MLTRDSLGRPGLLAFRPQASASLYLASPGSHKRAATSDLEIDLESPSCPARTWSAEPSPQPTVRMSNKTGKRCRGGCYGLEKAALREHPPARLLKWAPGTGEGKGQESSNYAAVDAEDRASPEP